MLSIVACSRMLKLNPNEQEQCVEFLQEFMPLALKLEGRQIVNDASMICNKSFDGVCP